MPDAARTVDIKLDFEQYDCAPNYEGWCAFEKKLFASGQRADDMHGLVAD